MKRHSPAAHTVSTRLARRGIAIMAALVALLVFSALSVTIVKTVLTRIQQAQQLSLQLQADALAESAIERATIQINMRPDYRTEVWSPMITGGPTMRAEIEWSPDPKGKATLHVRCTVSENPEQTVLVEHTLRNQIPLPKAN